MNGSAAIALVTLCFILYPFAFVLSSRAGEPPTEPILRLETGMHTAPIRRIATDAANRWLVTGSHDKTVRVWDLYTGELVRVLRPPIGPGDEGKIYAAALSPDGCTVACGGWTRFGSDTGCAIYLFDRTSGQLRQRLPGLPNVINQIVFSRDGAHLAAMLGGGSGLRVFHAVRAPDAATTWVEAGQDKDYGSRGAGADFDAKGRLVTACYDGLVRLYDADLALVAKRSAPGGKEPYSVAFSSDGAMVVVGFNDTIAVSVLDAKNLMPLYALDTTGVGRRNLGSVAFSSVGQWLYAGGDWDQGGQNPIRRWAQSGRGAYSDLLCGAQSTIMQVLPLTSGGVAWGAEDPAFGVLNPKGESSLFAGPKNADLRNQQDKFRVATDGSLVQFGFGYGGRSPARFSLLDRRLSELNPVPAASSSIQADLDPPRLSAPDLRLTDWQNKKSPAVNGVPLKLKKYEVCRSVAITPDNASFLLGTEWWLRLFDRAGAEKWNTAVPGPAWAVNIAANGQVALAAFGDGTIRWYRLSDGRELLALFPHADRKRWVLWTPAGYYDCSPGAEELIGWHVNRGKDQAADFFPAAQFRATFYRPDVIARILDALDEGEAVRGANQTAGRKATVTNVAQLLPPVVTILSPSEGETASGGDIELRFTARTSPDAPVTGVKALVDGRPVEGGRGMTTKSADDVQTLRVPLPGRDCEVAVLAENRHGPGEPARVRLKWAGATPAEFAIKPKLYGLVVGVSAYADASLALRYAAKDARDFAAALEQQKSVLYREVEVKLLTDTQANRDDVLDGLDWLRKAVTQHDVGVVFLAGHGVNDADGIYYYLPGNANPEKLLRTGVRFSDIQTTAASMAGKALFFVDTCHSGNAMGPGRRGTDDLTRLINELSSAENGAVVFAASTGRQYSLEDDKWQNGAFTKALVEGLNGKADYGGKGRITVNMLDLYLSERVKELTGGKQTPTTTKPRTVPDFPVAVPVK